MIIIYEGIDELGKSYAAMKHAGEGSTYVHFGKYLNLDAVDYQDMWYRIEALALQSSDLVYVDRSPLSEYCYGKVFRNESRFTEASTLSMIRSRTNKLYIYVPYGEWYWQTITDSVLSAKLQEVNDLYLDMFNKLNTGYFTNNIQLIRVAENPRRPDA